MSSLVKKLTHAEQKEAQEMVRPRPALLYEVVRCEGEIELKRSTSSLWWSGLAAGFSIGFSFLVMAVLSWHLKDSGTLGQIVPPLGYAVGFIIVIMSRQQLFTENTITVVLPFMLAPSWDYARTVFRLWSVVLVANLIGALTFSLFLLFSQAYSPALLDHALKMAAHFVERPILTTFTSAIIAGWLIAALVWVLAAAEHAMIWVIVAFTYVMAVLESSHIIAGSVEAYLMVLSGQMALPTVLGHFLLPTLAGNVIGGTTMFAMISYAQVRQEVARQSDQPRVY